ITNRHVIDVVEVVQLDGGICSSITQGQTLEAADLSSEGSLGSGIGRSCSCIGSSHRQGVFGASTCSDRTTSANSCNTSRNIYGVVAFAHVDGFGSGTNCDYIIASTAGEGHIIVQLGRDGGASRVGHGD